MRKRYELSAIANNIAVGFLADRYVMNLEKLGPERFAIEDLSTAKEGALILERFKQLAASDVSLGLAADDRMLPGKPDFDWHTAIGRSCRCPRNWPLARMFERLHEAAVKVAEQRDVTEEDVKTLSNFFDLLGEVTLAQSDELQSRQPSLRIEREWRHRELRSTAQSS